MISLLVQDSDNLNTLYYYSYSDYLITWNIVDNLTIPAMECTAGSKYLGVFHQTLTLLTAVCSSISGYCSSNQVTESVCFNYGNCGKTVSFIDLPLADLNSRPEELTLIENTPLCIPGL